MPKKTPYTEPDKLTNIKNWIKVILLSQSIVDKSGNILNIDEYKKAIDNEINKRELALTKISAPNYVVTDKDKDFASVLFGEIAFLKGIKTYTKDIHPLVENPLELRAHTHADEYGFKDLFHDLKIIKHRLSNRIKDPTTR